ncbi:putative ATPase/DNA-binding winged helix-turn-helix (wHTH) protein [Neorhizobium galegae]|uniref:ATP-binding protein n=1 Tax=Neorhizobium galegae TaxID=399 RepID=UPI001EB71AC4|nr:winged helix-turn-helix domain-containing protein [Neorhizobium galegae]MBP2558106.1 putative ATPase/DNA-binding winged helix-turn-helix (wHTH) protein [Neorhizobium galegae]
MNDLSPPRSRSFAFGPFVLLPERQLLMRGDVPVRIGGRALDILTVLVERPGAVIGKQELLARVWPDTFVEEGNLKVNMAALRRALDEPPGAARYIATVVGRGYRFSAPVHHSGSVHLASDVGVPAALNHNLPTATTRIVGRQDAIDAILRELREARLVSIVGAGGIGKTTVALAVAEHWIGTCKDGVWMVDLSPLKDPSLVPNAIATAIGLTAHSSNMLEALSAFLRSREMLLVFDSCEHIINGIASCADRILAEAPAVRILATSREALRVKSERVRRLPGLGTPAKTAALDAETALTFPAIELFVDRATDRLESFILSDADAPLAAELCRNLDGLALAIELAATRVDAFGLGELIEQLGDRFRLLQGHRGGIERHRTLTATIDWSYELLSEIEQTMLRRLAAFAGIFSLDSACAITIDEHIDRARAVENIASLVAKSLLTAEMHDTQVEYRMLDTTRAYALEKLVANNELEGARQRHAEHCLELVERATSDAERLTRTEWLLRYGPKTNDIRDAMRWAFTSADKAALGVRLTVAAIPFGKQVSLVEECRMAVERALDDSFQSHRSIRDDLVLNLTLGATLLHTRGPLLQVKSSLTKALAIAEQLDDTDMQLACLRGLSEYELWTGDSHSAIAVARKIRALETNGQDAHPGDANAQTGSALSWLGALAASRQQLENIVQRPTGRTAQLDVARFEFDQRLTAQGSLATVLWLQGFPDQAIAVARRQLEEAEASNYAVSLCSALLHGSLIIAMYVRDYEAAWSYLNSGLEHATKHGLSIWRNMGMCTRGRMCLYTHRPIDLAAYRDALAEVRDGGFRMRYPNYLTNYAEAVARQGDLAVGLAAIDEAIALCESRGQVVGIPEILRIKGNMIRFQEPANPDKAVECYQRSIELARQGEALSWELRSATSLVKLMRLHGGDNEAEDMLASAYNRFQEGFSTGDLVRARTLIATRSGAPGER